MEIIEEYFPELTEIQRDRFKQLEPIYNDWNSKINLVSRKDIDMLMLHHVLHSLSIAKVVSFAKGTNVVDIGTGGGFPGIPLAILFPSVNFTLVDSIGKKIMVVQSVAETLGLENVVAIKSRAEEVKEKFDFAITRAVAPIPDLMQWIKRIVKPGGYNHLPNGLIALKGGDIIQELASYRKILKKWKISIFFENEYFREKYIVYIPLYE
jgi:16S rRNA (guanine527-N7)-methyltransferase